MKFTDIVNMFLNANSLSTKEFSTMTDIEPSTLTRMLSGKREWSMGAVIKASLVMGLSFGDTQEFLHGIEKHCNSKEIESIFKKNEKRATLGMSGRYNIHDYLVYPKKHPTRKL